MSCKTDNIKVRLLEALRKSLGIVTTACNKADVNRSTFYRHYNEDDEFKNEVDNISEEALDMAESQLLKQIQADNTTAIIFYLKTKGKSRGYIERTEFAIPENIKPFSGIAMIDPTKGNGEGKQSDIHTRSDN